MKSAAIYDTSRVTNQWFCDRYIKTTAAFSPRRRIIAFGDLHGDFEALLVCLCQLSKVVATTTTSRGNIQETHYHWTGKDTCVVILGDMIDRFRPNATILDHNNMTPGEQPYDEDKILDLLNFLNVQAHMEGGMVLKILGNHELMNLREEFKYATPHAQQAQYGHSGVSRSEYFKPGGDGANKIISCGAVPLARIGDYVFVHGGILPGIVRELQQQGLKDIFQECADITYKAFKGQPLTAAEQETLDTLESKTTSNPDNINKATSFLWERRLGGNYNMSRKQVCIALRTAFKLLGLSSTETRIVVGHCPQSDRIDSFATENVSWKFTNVESADKHRTVLSNPSELIDQASGIPFGINHDCPTESLMGQVWRTDVAMSRAFDFRQDLDDYEGHSQHHSNQEDSQPHCKHDHLDHLLLNRRPQVLEINWDKNTNQYTEKVILSNKDLPRWWKDGDTTRVRVNYFED